jgi:site-specific recombinase XerD
VNSEQIQPFSQEQIEALRRAARRSHHPRRDETIVLFLLDTGVRVSELCNLKMSDLDLQGRRCTVIGKGNKRRTIHFGKTAGKFLWQYLREQTRDADDPVFLSDRGKTAGEPLTRSGVQQLIERLGNTAKLQAVRCSPHTFRHTFAVEFLRAGGNVFSLQQMLGHSGLHITNRYVALAQADLEHQHQQFSPADRLRRE